MKRLTVIFVIDSSNKCDLCLYDNNYSRSYDCDLVASLMEKTLVKAESSLSEVSLRATFNSLLDDTPLAYGVRHKSLPADIKFGSFLDGCEVCQIIVCDFTTTSNRVFSQWPALYTITSDDIHFSELEFNKSISDLVADVENLGSHKIFRDHSLYSVSSLDLSTLAKSPSIGNLEHFKKIADRMCLKTNSTFCVRRNSYGREVEVVYTACYNSKNRIDAFVLNEDDDETDEDTKFNSNQFALIIDSKDYLSKACCKLETHLAEKYGEVTASFYLNDQTRVLLDSSLFFVGTSHTIEIILFSKDKSLQIPSCKCNMKLKDIRYVCDKSDSSQMVIEAHFTAQSNKNR